MNKSLILSSLLLLTLNAQAADLKPNVKAGSVKKSASGICHGTDSRSYARLKHFTPYDNMKACLDSGGQMPGKIAKK